MVRRYLKAQLMVLLCGGLVGPVFLAVYFALGSMARPYLNWMFWVGLFVTAIDVLAALALTNVGAKSAARPAELTSAGLLAPARIIGLADTAPLGAPLTVSERLQQLDTLHATGAVTDEEYAAKRRDILAQL